MKTKFRLPKPIIFLGAASLFTDVASEAVYPLFPLFLTQTLGASVFFVGFFEGAADSVASLTQFVAGLYSDRIRKREPFVLFGYSLANITRPFIGFVSAPWQALAIRCTDRVGKGIRTAPRDAWMASFTTRETRGKVFGFHRMMDNLGAAIGPLLASAFLWFHPGKYRWLFIASIVPGILATLFIVAAGSHRENVPVSLPSGAAPVPVEAGESKKPLPRLFRNYLLILGLFTLGNSSDAFLLLKLRSVGVIDAWIPITWSALQFVKMALSTSGGGLSDRFGRAPVIIAGWLIYAGVYVTLGSIESAVVVIPVFLLYGVFYALTESPQKAFIADLIEPSRQGAAFGLFNLVLGLVSLPASLLFGFLWQTFGMQTAFFVGAALALVSAALLAMQVAISGSGNSGRKYA